MDELMEILEELRPDIDFETEKELVSGRKISSFDVISIVTEIDEVFDVKVKPAELIPENFDSAEAIWAMIQRLQDEF